MKTITIRANVTNEDFAVLKAALKSGYGCERMLNDVSICVKEFYGDKREQQENEKKELYSDVQIFFREYYRIKSKLLTIK